MKMAKKFLAVALAGVLALSVLTGCGKSVKSKDIADALTKMGVKTEQSKDVDKTAKETLKAIEAIVDASAKDGNVAAADKITLDNAVEKIDGKIINNSGVVAAADTANAVKNALGLRSDVDHNVTPAQKENCGKWVRVALVKTENATKDASLQAALVKDGLFGAHNVIPNPLQKYAEFGKLGSAKTSDGKYILVVIVIDIVNAA